MYFHLENLTELFVCVLYLFLIIVNLLLGNHGQALAFAGKEKCLKVNVVCPEGAPESKVEAMRHTYKANIIPCGNSSTERVEMAFKVLKEIPNSVFVPPFDHSQVMAGQGTVALEMLEQVPDLDCLIISVGGGGLLSGCLIAGKGWAKINGKFLKIFGGEPVGADDCFRSLNEGSRLACEKVTTICDALRINPVGNAA